MASTNTSTLTQELMDLISAEMLIAVDDTYLFFDNGPIQRADQETQQPGVTAVNFNRPVLPTGTYSETSRRLTDGAAIDQTGIAITETQVTLTTREYAGPHDGTAVRPFAVTEMLKNRAKHSIVALIGGFMNRDRKRFLDTVTRDLLLAATSVVTPDDSTEATIAAGQVASIAWLRTLNKAMKDALIPTFPNGNHRLIIGTRDEQYLKADPEYREAYRYFQTGNPAFKGHVMTYEGFDIVVSTFFSTASVGSGSLVTGYQGVCFGPYGLGWGVSLLPSVRAADETDFGRIEKIIWKSEEAMGALYTDLLKRTITT